jgi:hypothetical protein
VRRALLNFLLASLPLQALAEGVAAPQFESLPATSSAPARESFYITADVRVHRLGKEESLEGLSVFLDGQLVGQSPLNLSGYLVNRQTATLSVAGAGYLESFRYDVDIPAGGVLDIAVLEENPSRAYTRPAFLLGLALMAGSLVAYAQPEGEQAGLAMLSGGIGLVCLTQIVARWIRLPILKKNLAEHNQRHAPRDP